MTFAVAAMVSGLLCAGLIVALKPLLLRYALARPNARSSHAVPTPQGGGIAVVLATLGVATSWSGFAPGLHIVAAAALTLALLGAVDDIRPLPPAPRLLIQALAVLALVVTADLRVLPESVPLWLERILLAVAGLWFVNLVNFMDGIDWITVAGMVPTVAFIATWGALSPDAHHVALVAACLLGALVGFAPFNKPVARLFLGDVGSLPIGLLVGWLLLQVAGTAALVAALLLPLYHVSDATITLGRRLARRERVWEAHRQHFYQQALRNGFSVLAVSRSVFLLNLWLATLAAASLLWPFVTIQLVLLVVGMASVGVMLWRFSRRRSEA